MRLRGSGILRILLGSAVAHLSSLPAVSIAQTRVFEASTKDQLQGKTLNLSEGATFSSDGPISGPMLGYAFSSRNSWLYPIRGILGASYVAEPLPVGFSIRAAAVSPTHAYALAVDAASGEFKIIDLTVSPPETHLVPEAGLGVDHIVLSPQGKTALLYRRGDESAGVLTGLPERPMIPRSLDLSSLPGVITALAISDDGKTGLAAASSGDSGSLFALSAVQPPRLVAPLGRAVSLAFLNHSQDALAADYDKNEILLVQDVGGAAQPISLAEESDGIIRPIAVAASADNRQAIALSKASRRIALIPLDGRGPTLLSCRCEPTGLARLSGDSVFRLNKVSERTIFVLDAGSAEPKILFVPGPGSQPISRAPLPPRARTAQ